MMPKRRDEQHERLARSLAYVRKGGPLLMRACRCVSERRSRASTEVIGQYQSQPRDNHSPAMRPADAYMSACVHSCVRAHMRARTQASVRHSCKTNYFSWRSRCRRAYLVEPRDLQGKEGKRRRKIDVIGFAYDLPKVPTFCEGNGNAAKTPARFREVQSFQRSWI
jgi:hypothetical protein